MSHATTRKSKIFLSYSRRDMEFAEAMFSALEAEGYDVLIDKADIAAGEDWQARLGRMIVEADTVVFCLSPHSAASKVCTWEVDEAVRLGKRILPVVVSRVPDGVAHPAIAKLNFIFFDTDPEEGFEKLLAALETDLPWLREHTRLGDLALTWQAKKGNAGILRGAALEEAERWIASQPRNAATATDLHREFIAYSRKAAVRRQRNWIAGAVAVVVMSLGLTAWSEFNRREAVRQRERAEKVLTAATGTANALVFDLTQQFRGMQGIRVDVVRKILEKAQGLQKQLGEAGERTADLTRNEAVVLNELYTTLMTQGDVQGALDKARKALAIAEQLRSTNPAEVLYQDDVALSHDNIGTALEKLGDLKGAIESYRISLELREKIVARLPDNTHYKFGLSVSHEQLSSAFLKDGNLKAAFEHIMMAWDHRQSLALKEPMNQKWMGSLYSVSVKMGDIVRLQGNPDQALVSYRTALQLAQTLGKFNEQNEQWKVDEAISHHLIADILIQKGELDSALKSARSSQVLFKELTTRDPGNSDWQRKLASSYQKLGNVALAQGAYDGALANLKAALAIQEKLVKADPENDGWLRDVSLSQDWIGDVFEKQKDYAQARSHYQQSLDIALKLAASDPNNTDYQRDLSVLYNKIGRTLQEEGDLAGAIKSYLAFTDIAEKLAAKDKNQLQWHVDLALAYWLLAGAGHEPKKNFQKSLDVLYALKKDNVLPSYAEPYIAQLEQLLAGASQ